METALVLICALAIVGFLLYRVTRQKLIGTILIGVAAILSFSPLIQIMERGIMQPISIQELGFIALGILLLVMAALAFDAILSRTGRDFYKPSTGD